MKKRRLVQGVEEQSCFSFPLDRAARRWICFCNTAKKVALLVLLVQMLLLLPIIAEAVAKGRVVTVDGINPLATATGSILGDSSTGYIYSAIVNSSQRVEITDTIGSIQPFYWTNDAIYTDAAVQSLTTILRSAYTESAANNAPFVVVTHSWGTVLTYIALEKNPDIVVDKLITLGSPLSAIPDSLNPLRNAIASFTIGKLALQNIFSINSLPNVRAWHNYWNGCDIVSDSIPAVGGNNTDVLSPDNGIVACHSWYYSDAATWNEILTDVLNTEQLLSIQYSPIAPSAPADITFNAIGSLTTNAISYAWNFGDGQTGNVKSESHFYKQTGNYNVQLTMTDADGPHVVTETVTVRQHPIYHSYPNGTDHFTVDFWTDSSSEIKNFSWNFGDGSPVESGSSKTSVTHTYPSSTSSCYTVGLTMTLQDNSTISSSEYFCVGPGTRYIQGHTIYGSETWYSGGTYVVQGGITVAQGGTLTIEPGVRVESYGAVQFTIKGTLTTTGVTFTWADGVTQWNGISFTDSGASGSTLENSVIEHGRGCPDYDGLESAVIYVYNSSPTISGNTIYRSTAPGGIFIDKGAPVISGNTINGFNSSPCSSYGRCYGVTAYSASIVTSNIISECYLGIFTGGGFFPSVIGNTISAANVGISSWGSGTFKDNTISDSYIGIYIDYSYGRNPELSGNTYTNIGKSDIYVESFGPIKASVTWDEVNYRNVLVNASLEIAEGGRLTIESGITIKFFNSVYGDGLINVLGTLKATGVKFTWMDGLNQWSGIRFNGPGASNSKLENCVIEHANNAYYWELGYGSAISIENSSPTITGNTLNNSSANYGIYTVGSSSPEISNNTISGFSNSGIYVNSASPTVTGNTISGNGVYGLSYYGAGILDATNNNWGSPSGPLDNSDDRATGGLYNPNGLGNKVSDHVNYYPWTGMLGNGATAVPTGLSSTPGSYAVNLKWNANTEPHLGGYKIYYGTTTGIYVTPKIVGNVTSYKLTGLTNGTTYYIAISSMNTVGVESIKSAEISITPLYDATKPTDGTLTATPGEQQITLNWTAATDSGTGLSIISPYNLVKAAGPTPPANCTGSAIYQGASLTFTDTGLADGQTYSYRLCALDNAQNMSTGITVTASTIAVTSPTKIGIFDHGTWYLDSNQSWAWDGMPTDTLGVFGVGLTNAIPVVGDWTGDGTTKIGVFMDGTWYLDMNRSWQWDGELTDKMGVFGVGLAGAVPVVGDWNGDGITKIGIYSDGTWYLDMNNNWQWDGELTDKMGVFGVGLTGAVPVVGDWNGDGRSEIGVYQDGLWYLDKNGNWQWDGELTDQYGIFGVGLTGEVPVVGDWNADGTTKIGIYQDGLWYLDKNSSWQWDGETTDQYGVFGVGLTGVVPVPGKW